MNPEVRQSTRRSRAAVLVGAACVSAVTAAHAYTITNDTYIDSYQYTDPNTGAVLSTNQRTNYGTLGVVKVVTSAASASFPAPSTVRTLFTLPSTFISALGTSGVSSAIITYTAKNDGSLANRVIELHPLTSTFVAGTGGSPSSTMNGGDNTSGTVYGADWQTSNGVTPWATAGGGGDFDAADFVNDLPVQKVTTGGSTFDVYSWNIAPLLDNPAHPHRGADRRADAEGVQRRRRPQPAAVRVAVQLRRRDRQQRRRRTADRQLRPFPNRPPSLCWASSPRPAWPAVVGVTWEPSDALLDCPDVYCLFVRGRGRPSSRRDRAMSRAPV